MEGTKRQETK